MSHSTHKILLVEDEEVIGDTLRFNLEAEQFEVHWLQNGLEAIEYIRENHEKTDTILLDLMLPGCDGFEILRQTRLVAPQVPILVLSARSQESDRVKALEMGADDYVTKPFSLMELILRIKGLLRKKSWYKPPESRPSSALVFGECQFSPEHLYLENPVGQRVRLSPTEALLVQMFLQNSNVILSRQDLLRQVWHYDGSPETRTVDIFVGKLRKIIEPFPSKPHWLHSVRGVGYCYVTDPTLRENLQQ